MSQLEDVIATREIDVLDQTGQPAGKIQVHIGRPKQEETGEWGCPIEIAGVDRPRCAFGLDAIQAIELALYLVGETLAGTIEAQEGRLRWAGETSLGFPLLPTSSVKS
jgi:hypothetical protein